MTKDERFLYIQGAQLEFEWLCTRLGHEKPDLVAFGLTEALCKTLMDAEALMAHCGKLGKEA